MIVNILGKGDGWERIASIVDLPKEERGVIYGVNDAFLRTPQVDVTFHMHDLEDFSENDNTVSSTKLCAEHAKNKPEMEFYTVKPWNKLESAKEFPIQEIVDYFGVCYFSSTIEYAIAYAIWKGATHLRLFGVNMTVRQEYIEQKPGVEFWLGVAIGRGITVQLQEDVTSLFKTKDGLLYGYLIEPWKPDTPTIYNEVK